MEDLLGGSFDCVSDHWHAVDKWFSRATEQQRIFYTNWVIGVGYRQSTKARYEVAMRRLLADPSVPVAHLFQTDRLVEAIKPFTDYQKLNVLKVVQSAVPIALKMLYLPSPEAATEFKKKVVGLMRDVTTSMGGPKKKRKASDIESAEERGVDPLEERISLYQAQYLRAVRPRDTYAQLQRLAFCRLVKEINPRNAELRTLSTTPPDGKRKSNFIHLGDEEGVGAYVLLSFYKTVGTYGEQRIPIEPGTAKCVTDLMDLRRITFPEHKTGRDDLVFTAASRKAGNKFLRLYSDSEFSSLSNRAIGETLTDRRKRFASMGVGKALMDRVLATAKMGRHSVMTMAKHYAVRDLRHVCASQETPPRLPPFPSLRSGVPCRRPSPSSSA